MNMKFIYLDHSASTPTDPRVLEKMLPFWAAGNPSSLHEAGRAASEAIKEARTQISRVLNCHEDEIIYTRGGAENKNLALRGVAQAMKKRSRGKHIISTSTEHHSVLNVLE